MRLAVIMGAGMSLAACAPAAFKMYEGPERPASQLAIVSPVGLYPTKKVSVQIKTIDGKKVNDTHAAELLLLPGEYLVAIEARNDMKTEGFGPGRTLTWNQANTEVRLRVQAGHTYIPNADFVGGKVRFYVDDKGLNYKKSCIPLYRFAIAHGGRADGGNDPDC